MANGLIMVGNKILLNSGGNTNMGVPSNNFAFLPEYALSAAVLEIDLDAIGDTTYDLPTLDDEDRPGIVDENDISRPVRQTCQLFHDGTLVILAGCPSP